MKNLMGLAILALVTAGVASAEVSVDYDVLVVGAGTAGIPAAVAAARGGAKTLLVERSSVPGGTMTSSLIRYPSVFYLHGRQIIDGIGYSIVTNAILQSNGGIPDFRDPKKYAPDKNPWLLTPIVNQYLFMALCEEAVAKSGAKLLYHTAPMSVEPDDGHWRVRLAAMGKEMNIRVKEIIDATGNASIAVLAGAKRVREAEKPQPGTYFWTFDASKIDRSRYDPVALKAAWQKAIDSGELKLTDTSFCWGPIPIEKYVEGGAMGNANYVLNADNSTAEKATETTLAGRAMMLRVFRFLKRQPGLEHIAITTAAAETGVRETWRIVGVKTVTREGYLSGVAEDDAICYAGYPVDRHDVKSNLGRALVMPGVYPTVPFGALIPKGVKRLLVVGRAISADRDAMSALRVQATCMAEGEAAGVAAALAVKRGVASCELPADDVRAALCAAGAIVPGRRGEPAILRPAAVHAVERRAYNAGPSVAVAPNGRLWVTWHSGITAGEDRNGYIALATSDDDGRTWREVAVADPDGDGPRAMSDPQVWIDPDRHLRWSFSERMREGKGTAELVDSEGKTCLLGMATFPDANAAPQDLPRAECLGRGVMMGKPSVLTDGTWILPVARWHEERSSGILASSDRGATWQWRGGATLPVADRTFDEHSVVEAKDGTLNCYSRSNRDMFHALSHDGGRTWSEAPGPRIAQPSARFLVRRLASGNWLMVKHGDLDRRIGRSHLKAFLSTDEGRTWKGGLPLDERADISYPDCDQRLDGLVYVVYDRERTRAAEILLATFTEADVLAGRPVSGKVRLRQVVTARRTGSKK